MSSAALEKRMGVMRENLVKHILSIECDTDAPGAFKAQLNISFWSKAWGILQKKNRYANDVLRDAADLEQCWKILYKNCGHPDFELRLLQVVLKAVTEIFYPGSVSSFSEVQYFSLKQPGWERNITERWNALSDDNWRTIIATMDREFCNPTYWFERGTLSLVTAGSELPWGEILTPKGLASKIEQRLDALMRYSDSDREWLLNKYDIFKSGFIGETQHPTYDGFMDGWEKFQNEFARENPSHGAVNKRTLRDFIVTCKVLADEHEKEQIDCSITSEGTAGSAA
jgi:hypothetical protein